MRSLKLSAMLLAGMVGFGAMAITETRAAPIEVVATSGDANTSAYQYLAAMAATVTRNSDLVQVQALPTRGFVEGTRRVRDGTADVTLTSDYTVFLMANGLEGETVWENPRLLFKTYPAVMHAIVLADSDIQDLSDVAGRRLGLLTQGSISLIMMARTFEAAGVNVESDVTLSMIPVRDLIDGLMDGSIDMIAYHPSLGAPAIEELANSTAIRFVPTTAEVTAGVEELMPGVLSPYVMPANSYPGQTEDVDSLILSIAIYADARMEDDIAYELVATFLDNQDEAIEALSLIDQTDATMLSLPPPAFADYHPGALRALQERGFQ